MVLSINGCCGSVESRCHVAKLSPRENIAGSKLGLDTSASTSPVTASRSTVDMLCSPLHRRVAKSCIAMSSPIATSTSGLASTLASSLTTRPKAVTSTWRVPALAGLLPDVAATKLHHSAQAASGRVLVELEGLLNGHRVDPHTVGIVRVGADVGDQIDEVLERGGLLAGCADDQLEPQFLQGP